MQIFVNSAYKFDRSRFAQVLQPFERQLLPMLHQNWHPILRRISPPTDLVIACKAVQVRFLAFSVNSCPIVVYYFSVSESCVRVTAASCLDAFRYE